MKRNRNMISRIRRLLLVLLFLILLASLGAAVFLRAPRGVFARAEGDSVEVNEQTFPDPVFRGWILDSANLGGAGSDGVLTQEELAGITDITFRGQAGGADRRSDGDRIFCRAGYAERSLSCARKPRSSLQSAPEIRKLFV